MKSKLVYFIVFLAIWFFVAFVVDLAFGYFNIDATLQNWAHYTLIAIAAMTAATLTPMVQNKLAKLFGEKEES